MKNITKDQRVINTDHPVKNDGVARLPHERDGSPDKQSVRPRETMKQAYADIENGQVDTDLHGERGVEAIKNGVPNPQIASEKDKKKTH